MPRCILLTGMSGVGTSTVLAALAARGYRTVDLDDGYADEVLMPDGGVEQRWRQDAVAALLDGHVAGTLVVSGCATNQGALYDRFDAVILLSAPVEVMLERIDAREKAFGRAPDERARILADHAEVEPLLRRTCTAEVRTDRPLEDVVTDVLAVIGS